MNPLPKKPAASGAGRTVVVGGGTSGSGVTSVNGDAGPSVSLSAADVGAEPAITDSGWIAVTYNANWADFGTFSSVDYRRAQYRKRGDQVRVVGTVKRTAGSTLTPFTLPSGYRPTRAVIGLYNSNGAAKQVDISTGGVVTFASVINSQAQSFDITFDTDELT